MRRFLGLLFGGLSALGYLLFFDYAEFIFPSWNVFGLGFWHVVIIGSAILGFLIPIIAFIAFTPIAVVLFFFWSALDNSGENVKDKMTEYYLVSVTKL